MISRLREYFELLWLNLVVKKRNLIEFIRIIFRYYRHYPFMRTDLKLLKNYFLNSPYKISRNYLRQRQEKDIYAYGETPLTSLEKIAKECALTPKDVVIELGCGRGRTCFWLHDFVGCEVMGIEYIPQFVFIARKIQQAEQIEGMQFKLEDMFETDLRNISVIYLYGTCLSDEEILRLIGKFKRLPKGTKIITVSYSLNEYLKKPFFIDVKAFEVPFTWGVGMVYLQTATG